MGEFERETIDIPIRDENDEPLWLIHAAQKIRAVDIVAIPLDADALKGKVTLLPVNELAPGRIAIMIGMDVFILGYPLGSGPPAFPRMETRQHCFRTGPREDDNWLLPRRHRFSPGNVRVPRHSPKLERPRNGDQQLHGDDRGAD
jgi:hypothetical protein